MTKMTLATALWTCGIVAMTSAAGQDVRSTPAPTFNKDVAPILYKNCTNCHRPGEIAPMPLLTYQDARPWAKSIGRQVSLGAMPPWHGESQHHDFLNDRRLSEAEKATLVGWANGGAPEGDRADLT